MTHVHVHVHGHGDGLLRGNLPLPLALPTPNRNQAHLKETAYSEAAVGAIFDAIDVNDDGELSREELRGGLARYGALRLALGVGKYYDYEDPNSTGSKPTEYRYFW